MQTIVTDSMYGHTDMYQRRFNSGGFPGLLGQLATGQFFCPFGTADLLSEEVVGSGCSNPSKTNSAKVLTIRLFGLIVKFCTIWEATATVTEKQVLNGQADCGLFVSVPSR